GRFGVAARGVAHRSVISAGADQLLRAVPLAQRMLTSDDGIVVGIFPFDGDGPAQLVVPEVAVRSDPDAAPLLIRAGGEVSSDVSALARLEEAGGNGHGDTAAAWLGDPPEEISSEPSAACYADMVGEALALIRQGALRKVVLARTLVVEVAQPLNIALLLRRLQRDEPDSYVVAVPLHEARHLIGATPELLLRRREDIVTSIPLGGSAPRGAEPSADEAAGKALLASTKDLHEHALVVEDIVARLRPLCSSIDVPERPSLLGTATMWHLATPVSARLRKPAPSSLEVIAALHPTPAVCGVPRDQALAAIRELETVKRGFYSGVCGWMDGRGDGDWVVNLRCADIEGTRLRLFAGAGIVDGSDPQSEVRETESKFRTLLHALHDGGASPRNRAAQPGSVSPPMGARTSPE
ncbi:MAG TPA: isochorismate synthase, partial [Candidatus Sulfotelmatobacter sp.]|nr:isochorismate synthase [Candidatus Sulfotelmatobacter sp.]